jgi:hypothetical protein
MAKHKPVDPNPVHEAVTRYPLSWPAGWKRTSPKERIRAPFMQTTTWKTETASGQRLASISIATATQRLEKQIERLGGADPVLSTNLALRLDGRPRSENEPADPGAAIYFHFKGRARVFACDRFTRVADNIGGIAAHIDALRRIDRYGVGSLEQALEGYKALPADTAADWRTVFGFDADATVTPEALDQRFKQMARNGAHPDLGGSNDAMAHLNRAREYALHDLFT